MQEVLNHTPGGIRPPSHEVLKAMPTLQFVKTNVNPTHELLTPESPTANVNLDKAEGQHFVRISNYV